MQAAYLAEQHSDRATRVAANEFLHAVTLWIVGEPNVALHSASSAYIHHFTKSVQLGTSWPHATSSLSVSPAGSWHWSGSRCASAPSAPSHSCLIRKTCHGNGLWRRAPRRVMCIICAMSASYWGCLPAVHEKSISQWGAWLQAPMPNGPSERMRRTSSLPPPSAPCPEQHYPACSFCLHASGTCSPHTPLSAGTHSPDII